MYNYQEQKEELFKEENQKMFLQIRDNVNKLLTIAGAFRLGNAITGTLGDSWTMIACIDRLVELKEIKEISIQNCAGQDRIFIKE